MKLTSLPASESATPRIHAGDDHEPDHDPRGLHHLPAIGPLYPLQLAPASLQEVDQAVAGVSALCRRPSCRDSEFAAATAVTTIGSARATADAAATIATAAGRHRLVGEVLLVLELLLVERDLGLVDVIEPTPRRAAPRARR